MSYFKDRGALYAILMILAALPFTTSEPAVAQGGTALCGCYCGVMLRPPCGDDACKAACGYREPSGGGNPENAAINAVGNSISNSISSAITNAFNQSSARAAIEEQQRQMAQQVMQETDALAKHNVEAGNELLQREAEEARKLDDQQRADTLSNLQGVCPANTQLTLRPSTDFFGVPGNPSGTAGADPCATAPAPAQLAPPPAPVVRDFPPSPPGVECKWGDQGAAVVDLRCLGLDPDKPITIDPHVVRGQERVFPAQIDPATFENEHYNNGFLALMRPSRSVQDAMDAVSEFQIARLQRPKDPLVRNGLGLAQDILRIRQLKVQNDDVQSELQLCDAIAALMLGDVVAAKNSLSRARALDPSGDLIGRWSLTVATMSADFSAPGRDVKTVEMLVGNALVAESSGNYGAELQMMEMAKNLAPPGDQYVATLLDHARYLASELAH